MYILRLILNLHHTDYQAAVGNGLAGPSGHSLNGADRDVGVGAYGHSSSSGTPGPVAHARRGTGGTLSPFPTQSSPSYPPGSHFSTLKPGLYSASELGALGLRSVNCTSTPGAVTAVA